MAQITFANKVKIDDDPSIPGINKVRDVDMNEIKAVVNENYTDYVNSTTYSTSEKVIGTWNGKPLYSKDITGNMSQGSIPHGIENLKLKQMYGKMVNTNTGKEFPLPSVRPAYPEYEAGMYIDGANVIMERGSGVTASYMTFEITIEYGKTTD